MRFRDYVNDLSSGELVHEALVLVEQLYPISHSRFAAAVKGDPAFLGYDDDRELLARIGDYLLAIVAGLSGKNVGEADLWQRPSVEAEEPVGTIADFNVGAFIKKLSS